LARLVGALAETVEVRGVGVERGDGALDAGLDVEGVGRVR
jgi:hypothetical protein